MARGRGGARSGGAVAGGRGRARSVGRTRRTGRTGRARAGSPSAIVSLTGASGATGELPSDGEDAFVLVVVGKEVEEAGGHVEGGRVLASGAAVADIRGSDVAVLRVGDLDLLAAVLGNRVFVPVHIDVHGYDEVTGGVGPAAGSLVGGEEGSLSTGVGSSSRDADAGAATTAATGAFTGAFGARGGGSAGGSGFASFGRGRGGAGTGPIAGAGARARRAVTRGA